MRRESGWDRLVFSAGMAVRRYSVEHVGRQDETARNVPSLIGLGCM